jgi:hypothetical protein
MINLWRHKYQPGQVLDLYGFEVKRDEACDVRSVHETLAHTRLVHYAYLVWNYQLTDFSCDRFETVRANCEAYRLGLITFRDGNDGTSFVVHIEGKRATPSDAVIDEFIDTRFSGPHKKLLEKWLAEAR